MFKTKKRTKKSKTFRKRKIMGGISTGFVKTLRGKTRRNPTPERVIRRTVNPNGTNRFNRSGRIYNITSNNEFLPETRNIITPPRTTRENLKSPTWKDNGFISDNTFGPSKEGVYAGPSIKYGSRPAIPHGKEGTLIYPSGYVYTGDFVKGQREGVGKLMIPKGPTYEGDWKDDKFTEFVEWKEQNKKNKAKK